MKKTLLCLSLFLLLGSIAVLTPTNAVGAADQYQNQDASAECETETVVGAYGQIITRCKVDVSQEQEQKIVYLEPEEELVHEPADTALDTKTITAAAGTIISGAGAFIVKLKKKIG